VAKQLHNCFQVDQLVCRVSDIETVEKTDGGPLVEIQVAERRQELILVDAVFFTAEPLRQTLTYRQRGGVCELAQCNVHVVQSLVLILRVDVADQFADPDIFLVHWDLGVLQQGVNVLL